jgi:RNA polymerase sigma-70 factor (ECF subfamily)
MGQNLFGLLICTKDMSRSIGDVMILKRQRQPQPPPTNTTEPKGQSDRSDLRTRFLMLARRCEADLLRLARRLCKGGEDCAQDLAQETLVKAYEAFVSGNYQPAEGNSSDEGRNFRAWLLRIQSNRFINDYRRSKKWDAGVDVETLTAGGEIGPEGTRAAPADVPGATLLEETLDEPLERALARLPEGLRLCVLLVDVQGMEYAEAARILNIPVGTVRSRLARARYLLHQWLHDYAKERRILS